MTLTGAAQAHVPTGDDGAPSVLPSGGTLSTTTGPLVSPAGQYELVMQGDGNLVEYAIHSGGVVWDAGTGGHPAAAYHLEMQSYDGNLVLYDPANHPLWSSKTGGSGLGNRDAQLDLQDDGNIVVYSSDGRALWSSLRDDGSHVRKLNLVPLPPTPVPSKYPFDLWFYGHEFVIVSDTMAWDPSLGRFVPRDITFGGYDGRAFYKLSDTYGMDLNTHEFLQLQPYTEHWIVLAGAVGAAKSCDELISHGTAGPFPGGLAVKAAVVAWCGVAGAVVASH